MEFEQDDGRFIYEIRLLQSDGRMAKLKVDAVDGRVLDIRRKERGGTGMRILVVEDEPTLCGQLVRAITAAGHTVESASDGATAHYLGDVEDFDAVVLDLGLPALDGLSVLRRWRAAGRTMPVLILTARSAWHEKVAGIDAGADDYLAKPFHMEELLARLRAPAAAPGRTCQRAMAMRADSARHAPGPRAGRRPAAATDQP